MNPLAAVAAIGGILGAAIAAGRRQTGAAREGGAIGSRPGGFATAGKGTSSTSSSRVDDQIEARVAAAIASGSPGTMEAEAAALEAAGFRSEAALLREEARRVRAGAPVVPTGGLPPTTTGGRTPPKITAPPPKAPVPTSPPRPTTSTPPFVPPRPPTPAPSVPVTVLPEIVIEASPGAGDDDENPRRVAAQRVTDHLTSIGGLAGRFKENQSIVRDYQTEEQLTADGKYGPGTSLSILERHGLIPVAPYYWSKSNAQQQKSAYLARVRELASADPARRSQYDKLIADTNRS